MNKLNLSTTLLLTVALLFTPLLFGSCKVFNNEIEIEGEVLITHKDGSVENPMSARIAFFPKKALLERAKAYAVLSHSHNTHVADEQKVADVIKILFNYSDDSKKNSFFDVKLVKARRARTVMVARDGKFSKKLLIGDYLVFIEAYNAKEAKYYMWIKHISVDREGSPYTFHDKYSGITTGKVGTDALVSSDANHQIMLLFLAVALHNDFMTVFKKVNECSRGIDRMKYSVEKWEVLVFRCAN